MRYLLSWHAKESELRSRSPEWREEAVGFLQTFEDELLATSELEWVEVLSTESQAFVVGPDADVRDGVYNLDGKPSVRIWVIRVDTKEWAIEIAGRIAGELDTWIEVRECYSGSQRP